MTITFDGQVAIVSGGGRGLGAQYARELSSRGATVIVLDNGATVEGIGLDPGPANAVVAELVASGGRASACVADASTAEGAQAAIDLAVKGFGRLDVVVTNAGIIQSHALTDWTPQQFEAHLRHHLVAAFQLVRPAFAVMKEARYGRLVFVSSAAGMFGQPGVVGYAAAKTGVLGLMNVTALEGAEYGITANAVMPMADTRMGTAVLGEAGATPDARAFLERLRLDQVAPVVAYLASRECTATRMVLSAFAGRVAMLQVGVTNGWFSPTDALSAEDVARNLPTITDTAGLVVPGSIVDEIAHALSR